MSNIKDLIAELCPNGVEFKPVGEVIKKYSVKAKHDKSVELVYTISKDLGIIPSLEYWKEATSEKRANYQIYSDDTSNYNIIRKNMFAYNPARLNIGSINCLFDKPEGLLSPMYTIFSIDENIFLPKFFLYFLQTSGTIFKINNLTEEGARYRFDFNNWNKIKIPIPPLPVQAEIVRILDTFTELTAELTAELSMRKKQYEYYRDKLLTFEDVEYKKLGEIAFYSRERISAENLTEKNYVGVDNLLSDKRGKIFSSHLPKTGNCTKFQSEDILIGNIRPYLKKIWFADCEGGASGDVLTIRVADKKLIRPKFLYYCLASDNFFYHYNNSSKGGKMPRGDKNFVMDFKIPIPPLEEQERIVNILDKFDRLCNDLSEGIPAEIAARKKQYEYYRDLLLTFEEAR